MPPQKRKDATSNDNTQSKKSKTNQNEDLTTDGGDSVQVTTSESDEINKKFSGRTAYDKWFDIKLINFKNNWIKCAICKKCTQKNIVTQIKMQNSNTKGVRWHLQSKHPQDYLELCPSKKKVDKSQQLLSCSDKNKQEFDPEELEIQAVQFISIKYLPLNFFSGDASQDFFGYVIPSITYPKRTPMTQKVNKVFSITQNIVKDILQKNSSNISFTVDGWTSLKGKSYYGITAHFIDDQWKLQSLALDFIPSKGMHAGINIANFFYKSLKALGILEKVQGITVDNASVNTTFLAELEKKLLHDNIEFSAEDQHFRCFAHVINLAVQDVMLNLKMENAVHDDDDYDDGETDDEIDDNVNVNHNMYLDDEESNPDEDDESTDTVSDSLPLVKLRSLCKALKRSEKLKLDLARFCGIVNESYSELPLDVSTRWNSTHSMLVEGLKMKKALSSLARTHKHHNKFYIDDDEWSLLTMLEEYLRIFKQLSTALCGDQYATLPSVVTGINILIDSIEEMCHRLNRKSNRTKSDEAFILAFQEGRNKLIKHYQKINWIYCAVLILDPRHKLEFFDMSDWGKKLKTESYGKFESIYRNKYAVEKEQQAEEKVQEDSPDLDDEYTKRIKALYGPIKPEKASWKIQLDNYLLMERACLETDILQWWKQHENCYPYLAAMARDLLSITASSAPVERLFSKAGLVLSKKRNRVNDCNIRTLVCLNSWFKCGLYSDIKKY